MFVVLWNLLVFIFRHHYLSKEKLERLAGFLGKRVTFLYTKLMLIKCHERNVMESFYLRDWKPLRCKVTLFTHSTLLRLNRLFRFLAVLTDKIPRLFQYCLSIFPVIFSCFAILTLNLVHFNK